MRTHRRRIRAGVRVALAAAAVVCAGLAGACESNSVLGSSGRRARMPDEQLLAVLKDDFPVGASRADVHAKAAELGMTSLPLAIGDAAPDAAPEEELYSFSFAPESSWAITRQVRVRYTPSGRVDETVLVPRFKVDAAPQPEARGWIRLEGAP